VTGFISALPGRRQAMRPVEDFSTIQLGQMVAIVSNPGVLFTVTDIRNIFVEDGEVPNPVTLVLVTPERAQIITVSAHCLLV
jgi:hypothetical protein